MGPLIILVSPRSGRVGTLSVPVGALSSNARELSGLRGRGRRRGRPSQSRVARAFVCEQGPAFTRVPSLRLISFESCIVQRGVNLFELFAKQAWDL